MLHARPAQGAEGPLIKQGDLVVVYERHDSLKAVTVSVTSDFNNRFGHFKMKARPALDTSCSALLRSLCHCGRYLVD